MNEYPTEVKILNVVYTIEYVKKPSDVDLYKRETLWGQIDYWTRTIRIYNNEKPSGDVWQTIWHEILHGIANAMHIDHVVGDEDYIIDLLATGLQSVLSENDWVSVQ